MSLKLALRGDRLDTTTTHEKIKKALERSDQLLSEIKAKVETLIEEFSEKDNESSDK